MPGELELEVRGNLLYLGTETPVGKFKVKLSRAELRELAVCLDCCPGAKVDMAHALWHYRNSSYPRPCGNPEMWNWT